MPLSRKQFEAKKRGNEPYLFTFESLKDDDGKPEEVLLKPITANLYREYRASLRDENGDPIREKQKFGDELLVGKVLMDSETGHRMYSDDAILAGALDDFEQCVISELIVETYRGTGLVDKNDEDREKNLSGTNSQESSSE